MKLEEPTNSIHKPNLKMVCASIYIPKEKTQFPQGQEANFICAEAETVGVADGVGGSAKHGIDSGIYARALMENAAIITLLLSTDPGQPRCLIRPKRILEAAYMATVAEGSSTACIVSHRDGVVSWVNLGDSGVILFRDGKMTHRSQPQQHRFNHPYQLGNGFNYDIPAFGEEGSAEVAAGDVLVVGTDGLFDNVFPETLEEVVERFQRSSEGGVLNLDEVASNIAQIALNKANNCILETPFSIAAKLAGENHRGGKIDDITILVAQIVLADLI